MNDFDNDGNKDLFITSGIIKRTADLDYARFRNNIEDQKSFASSKNINKEILDPIPDGSWYCYLFQGDGAGGFADRSREWGIGEKKGYYNGASYADLDRDGDLDIVVNALNGEALLYRNNTGKKNYVSLRFVGEGSNRFGVGAKAYVFGGGKLQYQQLMLTRGFQSSIEPRLHFGLGSVSKIDSLLIVWPDQRWQVIKDAAINKQLEIRQGEASGVFFIRSVFSCQGTTL